MTRWSDAGRRLLDVARAVDPDVRGSGIGGVIGDALFACALRPSDPLAAHECVQRAIDDLEARGAEVSLHRGLAGLGFVIAMYRSEEEDLLSYVDEVALGQLDSVPPGSVQSGGAGIALYASLRSAAASGRNLQRAVVERLRTSAVPSDEGVLWFTPAWYAQGRGIEVPGEPVLEVGVLHGLAGTLVGLAALSAQGSVEAARLARAGLAAAWAQQGRGANRFGRVAFGARGALGTREWDVPRWCVGDPGVLRALWLVARALGDATAAERAAVALREDAARDARGVDLLEGRLDLCCGAAAVAQVYLRMHRETGERVFRDANLALLARCAEGYDRLESTTLPYGKMGVVLALLAAEREDDPSWDGMLGMSVPHASPTR